MVNGFSTFLILIIGISLLCYHLIRVAQSIIDSNDDAKAVHGYFALLCLPFAFEFSIIANSKAYGSFDIDDLIIALAVTGWLTLYAVAFEIVFRMIKASENTEGWIVAGFIGLIAIFDIWRLYEIIMVREHFWVLILPLVVVGFAIAGILENGGTQQQQSPPAQPRPAPPPQPKLIIDNEEDHPIKPDPASIFEKRGQ